jgi:hypothetical protein
MGLWTRHKWILTGPPVQAYDLVEGPGSISCEEIPFLASGRGDITRVGANKVRIQYSAVGFIPDHHFWGEYFLPKKLGLCYLVDRRAASTS